MKGSNLSMRVGFITVLAAMVAVPAIVRAEFFIDVYGGATTETSGSITGDHEWQGVPIYYERGDFDPRTTTGAWAGEIGMVQMLPRDILENGQDADGDGHVRLKTSAPDALVSGAAMLADFGWRAGEPWLQEVRVPATLDWSQSGIHIAKPVSQWAAQGVTARSGSLPKGAKASLILPQGHKGPAFLAYPNFNVYFDWNQSFTYVVTAAYFATLIEGAPKMDKGSPEQGLNGDQMVSLQKKLRARGHDVGKADGILGAKTRIAVQNEQKRLGLPADAWPTRALLSAL